MRASGYGTAISGDMLLLAAGGCAEHEFGIKELRASLGTHYGVASITDVLEGRDGANNWPKSVDDYLVTDGKNVTFIEAQLKIPASIARKVMDRKERSYDKGLPQKACRAYIEAMTAAGNKRIPSVTLNFGMLCLVRQYSQDRIASAAKEVPVAVPGKSPSAVAHKTLQLIISAASDRDIYLPDIQDLLWQELVRRGYGPTLTDEERARATSAIKPRAAWSGSEFCIVGLGDDCGLLRKFAEGFQQGKVYCGLSAEQNPFARSGLAFVHADAITPELRAQTEAEWAAQRELLERVRQTNIVPRLKAADRRYFALGPRLDEAGQLSFWLNPSDQRKYSAGWMTLQDLEDWLEDKGKVLAKDKAAA